MMLNIDLSAEDNLLLRTISRLDKRLPDYSEGTIWEVDLDIYYYIKDLKTPHPSMSDKATYKEKIKERSYEIPKEIAQDIEEFEIEQLKKKSTPRKYTVNSLIDELIRCWSCIEEDIACDELYRAIQRPNMIIQHRWGKRIDMKLAKLECEVSGLLVKQVQGFGDTYIDPESLLENVGIEELKKEVLFGD